MCFIEDSISNKKNDRKLKVYILRKSELKQKSIKINAVINIFRQLCTVLFPLITIPYVSRVLGTENFGKVNFGSTYVGYFSLLAAFGVNTYAIREGAKLRHNKEKLDEFCCEIFTFNVITTVISYLCLLLSVIFCKRLSNYIELIWVQSLVIIFTTIGVDWINVIYEDYLYTTIRYIVVQAISLAFMFVFVRSPKDYIIYAMLIVFSKIAGDIVNIFYIRRNYIHIKIVKVIHYRKHFWPMLFLFGNLLASTIYVNSDITLLTLFKGDSVTGVYSISVKIYSVAKQLIIALVSVAIPRVSIYIGRHDMKSLNILLDKIMNAILVLVIPCLFGLFALSKNVMVIIGGNEYEYGATALQILTIALLFALLSYFFVYLAMIPLGLEKKGFITTVLSACINVGLNLFFIPQFSLNGAAITTVISECFVMFVSIIIIRNRIKLRICFKRMIPVLIGSVSVYVVCFIFIKLIHNIYISFVLSVFGCVLLYGGILILFKDELVMGVVKHMKLKFTNK